MVNAGWMNSPAWLAAGSVMVHLLWVGAVIGLLAFLGRTLLRGVGPQVRYGFSMICFIAMVLAPVAIAFRVVPAPVEVPTPVNNVPNLPLAVTYEPLPSVATERIKTDSAWDVAVSYLPWLWLIGTPLVLLLIATGLVGSARLRRRCEVLQEGDVANLCHRLADSLGVTRTVAIGICRHIASPILVGIARPLILLPPAALTGWSVAQLEMVLLHELAHVRRWDSLVNLFQRIVEAVLFFHPVVWWLSAWIRLERELCCDAVVVRHTGRPREYAETLAGLADVNPSTQNALAMAEHNLVTRIRCLLKVEDRSMKISMKPFAIVAGLLVASAAGLHYALPYQQPPRQVVDRDPPKENVAVNGHFEEVGKANQPLAPLGDKAKGDAKTLSLRGNVAPSVQATLHARISAPVDKVNVDTGDSVKQGQILATLSVPELELELKQKKALLAQAEAEFEVFRQSVEAARAAVQAVRANTRIAEAELLANKAHLALAAATLAQAEEAFRVKQQPITSVQICKSEVERTKALEVVAVAKVEAAKARVLESEAKFAGIQRGVQVVQAKLEVAKADLETTQLRLQHAVILAPFDGIVINRKIEAGGFVSVVGGKVEPLFTIARAEPVLIVIFVPEANIGRVRKGAAVKVQVDAYANQTFEGKVSKLAPTIDPRIAAVRVEIELNNAGARMLPGMTATATLTLE